MADAMETLARMTAALTHRGPDDQGTWHDGAREVFLGQRRLSVLDLSPAGHQPMHSSCGRYALVFNGEIYDHLALRESLERAGRAPGWRGHSDSETLLACVAAWGMERTLERADGMFAIALWDDAERALWLARDRLGEKPLYYGTLGGTLMFGSELHALKPHPRWRGEVDRQSVAAFLRRSAVPAPRSIYANVHKLPPGHLIRLGSPEDSARTPTCYWSPHDAAVEGVRRVASDGIITSEAAYADELEVRLQDSVRARMLSDVPLGAFLSGGIDSSLVVALMQRESSRPVRTFTIGFREAGYDEAPHARAVAAHLGTDHTEHYVDAAQALELVPRLASLWDEPFADASQIPTYLVSALARESVTVSLSGDGGDELFYGYPRFEQARALASTMDRLPQPVRRALGRAGPVAASLADALTGPLSAIPRRWLARAALAGHVLSADDHDGLYQRLIELQARPPVLDAAGKPLTSVRSTAGAVDISLRFEDRMMLADQTGYLPDVVLAKVDRAAMAVGLETRAPFLERGLVEFAWRVPPELKLRDGQAKWLPRQVLDRHVPRHLVERPKQGFGVPVGQWMRGPLRDWVEALLDERTLREQGLLDVRAVRRVWESHRDGAADRTYPLWCLLMLQAWLEREGQTNP